MSEIKAPVTVEHHHDCFSEALDGDGCLLFRAETAVAKDIAAALNAAPDRAFEKLTAEEFGKIMRESGRDVIAAHGRRPTTGDASSWDMRANEFLLSRLQGLAAPIIPEGWTLVPVEPTEAMGIAGKTVVIGDGGALDVWEEMLNASPPAPLRTETAVRAEARREALEEAAKAAEGCDSPFNSPTDEQHEAVDLMARRVADTIRALIDRP